MSTIDTLGISKETEANVELWIEVRDKIFTDYSGYECSKKLAELLGIDYPQVNYVYVMKFTPELRSKLEALAGPYGEIVLKMIEVRKHE